MTNITTTAAAHKCSKEGCKHSFWMVQIPGIGFMEEILGRKPQVDDLQSFVLCKGCATHLGVTTYSIQAVSERLGEAPKSKPQQKAQKPNVKALEDWKAGIKAKSKLPAATSINKPSAAPKKPRPTVIKGGLEVLKAFTRKQEEGDRISAEALTAELLTQLPVGQEVSAH